MRFATKTLVALVVAPAIVQASTDSAFAATNCGFLTIEQCRATASGMGGFCVINQFYNPKRPAKDARKRHAPTRCPAILIRGAPSTWTVTSKAGETLLERPVARVAAGDFGFLTLIQVFQFATIKTASRQLQVPERGRAASRTVT